MWNVLYKPGVFINLLSVVLFRCNIKFHYYNFSDTLFMYKFANARSCFNLPFLICLLTLKANMKIKNVP